MMRTIVIGVASLALAGVAYAQGPPGGAEHACQQARQTLGEEAFGQAFGSMDGCVAKLAPVIESATAECAAKGLAGGTPEFKACVQDRVRAAIKQQATTKAGGKTAEQAQKSCAQLREKIGAAKFEQRYGSLDACVAEVTKAMSACAKETKPGSAEFKQCLEQRSKSTGTPGKDTAAKTAEQAQKSCAQLREKIGAAKFDQRYGSLDACVAEVTKAMSACAKETKPGSTEFKQCLEQRSKSGGGGKDTGAKTAEQAQKSCAQLREKIGAAKFEQRYGSLDACVAEVTKAISACAKETKPGSTEFKRCLEERLSRR